MTDSRSLGKFDKFFTLSKGEKIVHNDFSDALNFRKHSGDSISIDFTGVFEALSNNFMMGNRTVVSEINRTPWLSDFDGSDFLNLDIPCHKSTLYDYNDIAHTLYELLENELINAIGAKSRVGILLSGGMDSRFVAGVLYNLIKSNKVKVEKVVAYTWGNLDSRDYQYAKLIANELQWIFKSFLVDANNLWKNIEIAANRGCEYSCLHLHAMPQIAVESENEVDIILAGSYGDSVGRAEYSGVHATKLDDYKKNWGRYSTILNAKLAKNLKPNYLADIDYYRDRFSNREKWQIYEIERQCHYMRRMLNPCMEIINQKTPLYQAFTHPSVYAYMWSLDSSVRNDMVYKLLLKKIEPSLAEIPWARTGLAFGAEGVPDEFKKSHHNYAHIVNFELIDKIEDALMSSSLFHKNDNIFALIKLIRRFPQKNFDYLEKICFLTSLSMFYFNNLGSIEKVKINSLFSDRLRLYAEYILKTTIRKL